MGAPVSRRPHGLWIAVLVAATVLAACTPSAPPASPTAATAAKPTTAPAAANPSPAVAPAASPAPSPAAKPAASPAAAPAPFAPKPGVQLQTVRLAQSIPALSFAPLYIARDMGFFEYQGVKLQFTELQSGTTAQQAILSGSVDLNDSASIEVVSAASKGIPLIAIQNTINQTLGFCIRKDFMQKQGVTPASPLSARIAALKGATLGITAPGSSSDLMTRWLLKKYGNLDPNIDTQIVQIGGANLMAGAMEQNRLQAFLFSPPNCEPTLASGIGEVLMKPSDVPEFKNYVHEVLYATRDWVEKNPELASKTATAISMGNNYMLKYPEESIRILQKTFSSIDAKLVEQSIRESVLPQVVKDGKMTEEMWQATTRVLFDSGVVDKPLDPKEGVLWTNKYVGDATIP